MYNLFCFQYFIKILLPINPKYFEECSQLFLPFLIDKENKLFLNKYLQQRLYSVVERERCENFTILERFARENTKAGRIFKKLLIQGNNVAR